ncbi:hypothetical protein AOL_s00081g67 [Orbilia oligospora ATCC 24927]|uniref:Thiolase-like protein type 1 additional C-terminal domain-containing protein n=1 Tax=Arthrobotrys oligospora (strain ATCC 24927 / CBS 115.81 / DSM 1491) TaxID=756982 RepID=G1XFC6_ARTOA|nr:hypothetical protein AOL_s00081g67 [Orbilia oligospora ATCC 24927]EGX48204.1 hypothetical protein AOL_s00081g67 [Orbilia oligospora ATCC 24927]
MAAAVPVIIGVADVINRSARIEDAKEPADLMHQAILDALKDTNSSKPELLKSSIDSIDAVNTWTWPYPDLPGLLAEKLGINPTHKHTSIHGGNQPGFLFDEAARRISKGQTRVAVLTGGEALASLGACAAAGKLPPPGWSPSASEISGVPSPTTRDLGSDLGGLHDIGAPIHIYPLYENGYRAHRKQSISDNHKESSKIYAELAKIAEKNPYAWNFGKRVSEETIGTVGGKNRMICFPYPLLMNAFNSVNLAGAVILTSTQLAEELGIPKSKWIYALGGAGTQDSTYFWLRPNFYSSPAITQSLDAALRLRSGKGSTALVLANGGSATYEHVICISSQPRPTGSPYPASAPLPEFTEVSGPPVDETPEGEAVIETYTVSFHRSGKPELAYIVGRLKKNDYRFVSNHADEQTLKQLCSTTEEPIGKTGWVFCDKVGEKGTAGRCYFTLEKKDTSKL